MTTALADWKGVPAPTATLLEGRFIRLERLDPARHGDELFNALEGPGADPKLWDYLPYGPFPERSVFNDWLNNHAASSDPYFFSVIDRVTGEVKELDPRLVDLLRALVKDHPGARIELVSGYRSPKLNEMMRKKGRHVASHSQHSLGHAVDFRLVLPEQANVPGEPSARAVHPRELEARIRALGWEGGVGVYTLRTDWFVHADVGRNRRWSG